MQEAKPNQEGMDRLTAVLVGSRPHLEMIRSGYRTHHLDGRIVWMQKPARKPLEALRKGQK